MTTANAAGDATAKAGTEKGHEKLAEKRRALGRGLESLLPGPRVVAAAPTHSQQTRMNGAPEVDGSQVAGLRSQESGLSSSSSLSSPPSSSPASSLSPASSPSSQASSLSASSAEFLGGRAGAPVAPLHGAVSGTLDRLQAVASGLAPDGEAVFLLGIDLIDLNPYQTRREFNAEALDQLARSITVQGVLQPIAVRPGEEGRFILILGERRLRASVLAGKAAIPAMVKRVSAQQAAEMTLVENLQRQDLNCMEQAEAFANLSTAFNLTQEDIGKRAGVSRETVANYMRLLTLPEGVIGALQQGRLTYSHARTLLHLRDNAEIWKFAQKAIAEKLSVAKLEDLVLGVSAPGGRPEPNQGGGARWVDPNVKAAQRSLEEVLGMRVRIRDRRGRGKIVIEYGTLEDFDRVVSMLKGK